MGNIQKVSVNLSEVLTGFDGEHDLGAGLWIAFDYIPSDVNIEVAFDNNSQSRINAKQGMKIKVKHNSVFLWSDGVSVEEMIINQWSNEDMEIVYPPSSDFDNLQNLGAGAIASLDKIFNPYEMPTTTLADYSGSSGAELLSKTLTSDKIKVNLRVSKPSSSGYARINLSIDGIILISCVSYANSTYGWLNQQLSEITLENIKGKDLKITCSNSALATVQYALQEYTLKT